MNLGQNWSNIVSDSGNANVTSKQSVATNNPDITSLYGDESDTISRNKYKQGILEGIINAKQNTQQA